MQFYSIGDALPPTPNDLTSNQYTILEFNTTRHEIVTSPASNAFIFILSSYINVTIKIETQGNLSVDIPFIEDGNIIYHTDFMNFSQSVYLNPNQYAFTVIAEMGKTSEYWITLVNGNKVIDYHNHEISSAYPFVENQIVSHILNSTDEQWTNNWYNFTISQSSSYRFNLEVYKDNSFAGFDIVNQDSQWQSHNFPVTNISDTIVTYMTPGNYSLRVFMSPNPIFSNPVNYKLWFTTQYELQAPGNVKIGDQIYGVVEKSNLDVYKLQVQADAVIWFLGSDSLTSILITGENINQSVTIYLDFPTLTDYLIYLPLGDYTMTVYSLSDGYIDYYTAIRKIEPDYLEYMDNSQQTPLYLENERTYTGFNIHIPTDRDWFAVNGIDGQQGAITLDRGAELKVFDSQGNEIQFNIAAGYSYYFLTTAQTYIIEVFAASGEIVVLNYHAKWSSLHVEIPTPQSRIQITETSVKIGYPFGETLLLMGIPIVVKQKLKRFEK